MLCSNCNTENMPESKFCRECGQKLDVVDVKSITDSDETVRVGELVYAAYKHKEAGRTEDALAACQAALVLNPRSASGHALLGSLYEQMGDLDKAISSYETVVELNPDSRADKIYLAALRKRHSETGSFAASVKIYSKFKPFLAYAAAVLTFVVAIGAINVIRRSAGSDGKTAPSLTSSNAKPAIVRQIDPIAEVPVSAASLREQKSGFQQAGNPGASGSIVQTSQGVPPIMHKPNGMTTTSAVGQETSPDKTVDRKAAVPVVSAVSKDSAPVIVPVTDNHASSKWDSTPVITPVESPPVITPVEMVNPMPVRSRGSSEEQAIQAQRDGRYHEAIVNYRDTLAHTRDKGRIYQQIGMCYQRMGQHDLAVDNYQRAIGALKSQIAAGRDPVEAERNIKACERAIDVNR